MVIQQTQPEYGEHFQQLIIGFDQVIAVNGELCVGRHKCDNPHLNGLSEKRLRSRFSDKPSSIFITSRLLCCYYSIIIYKPKR